jgi:aminoglycoside/choline kinase family phosphotransferase
LLGSIPVERGVRPAKGVGVEEALGSLFRARFGLLPAAVTPLKSDGSGRRYWRLAGAGRAVIGVHGPDADENRAFLEFSRHFRAAGLPVPEIYAEDPAQGLYLQEDLGDGTLFSFLTEHRVPNEFPSSAIALYEKVVQVLPRFQIEAGRTLNYDVCYPRGSFDQRSILWDLNYFKYYFLRLAGIPFHEQELEDDFQRFTAFLLEAGQEYFLYRDFQSRNIMIRDDKPWFIDYQGGRRGPLQYDIASLLYDAKADVPPEVRDRLLDTYLNAATALAPISREQFMHYYPAYVLVRIMQALGAYGLRGFYERKTHFLQSIPFAIRNLEHLLATTRIPVEVPALLGVFRALVSSSRLRHFEQVGPQLTVRVQSFSYKGGLPTDEGGHGGGFVFDCRALPNPGRYEQYAALTGNDREVVEFLQAEAPVREFLRHAFALVDQSVENYRSRNFTNLVVAFGCTGGRHRSVYCAERLAEHLRLNHPVRVELAHRSLVSAPAPTP